MRRTTWTIRKNKLLIATLAFSLWCLQPHHALADVLNDLTEAIKSGIPTLSLRLGYEYSDVDNNGTDAATGFNLQTRVGYKTGQFMNTAAYIQFQNVANLVEDFRYMHDGKVEGNPGRDVIADPDGSRVQQAHLDFTMIPGTTFRLGRQEIILDNHRLIGNIGWRQNGQTFDAVSLTNKSIQDVTFFASYVNEVNTILLDNRVDGAQELDSLILLNAGYSGIKDHDIIVFCYLLDTDNQTIVARDSATYGFRFTGAYWLLNYAFDYAIQSDYEDSENQDGSMFNAFLGAKIKMFDVGGGYSYISGQDGNDRPFDTLFSTVHKFNGWADQFAATSGGGVVNGLEDTYCQASTKVLGAKVMARYHYFNTTENSTFDGKYGDEFDFLVTKKLNKNLSFLLKSAFYNAHGGATNPTMDENVFWARLQYTF